MHYIIITCHTQVTSRDRVNQRNTQKKKHYNTLEVTEPKTPGPQHCSSCKCGLRYLSSQEKLPMKHLKYGANKITESQPHQRNLIETMLHIFSIMLENFIEILTRCSAITERLRCRVRHSFGQKWKTGTGRQYFTDIIGLSSTTVI